MRVEATWLPVIVLAVGLPAVAAAQGPTFDCAKAQGQVEKLICSDADLAARDRKLDAVYKAVAAKAKGPMLNSLRTEQRGWVKGRNDCWKAGADTPEFLTASWQAKSVRECVEGKYKLRTSELQAVWRIVPPRTVSFACENNPANEIVANFFETDPPSARVERGDKTWTVWQVESGSGAKYEGQNITFWSKGSEATASMLNVETGKTDDIKCTAR
jgi:uncharacterized protein